MLLWLLAFAGLRAVAAAPAGLLLLLLLSFELLLLLELLLAFLLLLQLLLLVLLLGLLLRLAGRAAPLQFLVFYLLLPPLLRRQTLVTRGQGHTAGLGGPGSRRSGWGPLRGSAGRVHARMEFSRFDFTGRRDRRLHLSRSGVSPRLARNQGLPRSMGARSSGLCGFRRGARGVPAPGDPGLRVAPVPPALPSRAQTAGVEAVSGSAATFGGTGAWWPWRAMP